MDFRKDINGLRAIAVIGVVLFHFNPSWLSGGFAGVDVFFVISGFLMTRIIHRGIEAKSFSLCKFYVDRINRIVPALVVLCSTLVIFGWFYLTPEDYSILGKHIVDSLSFISNITYWSESGYFDAASHQKWLLHTWSLSVEWQFYIIYPVIILFFLYFFSLNLAKYILLIFTVLGYLCGVVASEYWPDAAYFFLPTRAWEMLLGGVAYLFPLKLSKPKMAEIFGLFLILSSFVFFTQATLWPGSLSILPTLGAFLIIQANQHNSVITANRFCQYIGSWSYSIYLWHWPIVVAIYYFSLDVPYVFLGIVLSIILGFLSYKYVESVRFNKYSSWKELLLIKPLYGALFIILIGQFIYQKNGISERYPQEYHNMVNLIAASPLRDECHINTYRNPNEACEYFESDITWAILGDSHTVELAYAMAEKLKNQGVGLKHFSFSGCEPSYRQNTDFSKCAKWYNDVMDYIINNKNIKNVVFNHRFTSHLAGDQFTHRSEQIERENSSHSSAILASIDNAIHAFSQTKEKVYVFTPIPELNYDIKNVIGKAFVSNIATTDIISSKITDYEQRNRLFLEHINQAIYPDNVEIIDSTKAFCKFEYCLAVKDGKPLYFDTNHPSSLGAKELIDIIGPL